MILNNIFIQVDLQAVAEPESASRSQNRMSAKLNRDEPLPGLAGVMWRSRDQVADRTGNA